MGSFDRNWALNNDQVISKLSGVILSSYCWTIYMNIHQTLEIKVGSRKWGYSKFLCAVISTTTKSEEFGNVCSFVSITWNGLVSRCHQVSNASNWLEVSMLTNDEGKNNEQWRWIQLLYKHVWIFRTSRIPYAVCQDFLSPELPCSMQVFRFDKCIDNIAQ